MIFAFLAAALSLPAMAQVPNVGLQPGQSITINSSVLQQYGGYVNVQCIAGPSNTPPPPPPQGAPPPSTINLAANCGNGTGFCDCSSLTPNYPDPTKANGLCQDFGFNRVLAYRIAPAPVGYGLCAGLHGGCITNNTPGTVICTSITCSY